MKKAIKIILAVCVVVALVVGGIVAWAYYEFLYTTPLTEAEIAELEVDWSVVTGGNWSPWVIAADGTQEWNPAKSFNDWLATVPEEDKAWVVFVDLQYGEHGGENGILQHEDLGMMPVYEVQWARLVAMFETDEAAGVYERLNEAFRRPVMGAGLYNTTGPIEQAAYDRYGLDSGDWNPDQAGEVDLLAVLLPALGRQKSMVDFQLGYGAHALERGDPDLFLEAVDGVMLGAKLTAEAPLLISQLVKLGIERRVSDYIDWAIDQHTDAFTDQHLAALDAVLAKPGTYALRWQGEAMMFEDTVRRLADENGSLEPWALQKKAQQMGVQPLGSATDLPVGQLHASAQRLIYIHRGFMKRGIAAGDNPGDLSLESSEQFYQKQQGYLGRLERIVLEMLLPSLGKGVDSSLLVRRYSNAVRIAIAARRHELRHGELPATLGAIDADLVDGVDLTDPFTGELLIYSMTDSGLQVLPNRPEDELDSVLWPKQYEPIVDRVKPEVYDWEYPDKTPEEIEEMNRP